MRIDISMNRKEKNQVVSNLLSYSRDVINYLESSNGEQVDEENFFKLINKKNVTVTYSGKVITLKDIHLNWNYIPIDLLLRVILDIIEGEEIHFADSVLEYLLSGN
jgi:hypothetical protein